jgi:hypothetical protein
MVGPPNVRRKIVLLVWGCHWCGDTTRAFDPRWYGAGLQPLSCRWDDTPVRCPGLVWGAPLALMRR